MPAHTNSSRRAVPTIAQRRYGTAATEFIIVLPLIMLIGLACLDIGRAVQHYSVMANAASAGAQCGATNRFFTPYTSTAWETKVRETVREELASLTAAGAQLPAFDIRIETDAPAAGDDGNQRQPLPQITVTIDYDFPTTFRWPGLPKLIPLHCKSMIRQYR
jgi:Flp pilus assembly protein TadG